MSSDFNAFMDELRKESVAAGPRAAMDLEKFEAHFKLAYELTKWRQSRGLTQKELAKASGVQQSDISKIERGKSNPTLSTLNALAAALGATFGLIPIKSDSKSLRGRAVRRAAGRRG